MDKYEHGKAKTIITLTDKNGRRLCGEKVTARLANHEFLFGWGAFDVVECANAVTEEQKLRYTPPRREGFCAGIILQSPPTIC